MRRLVLTAFALSMLAGCQPATVELTEEDVTAIGNLRSSYVQAVRTGDPDGVVVLYAEDATEMPMDLPARQGRAAIQTGYTDVGLPDFEVTSAEVYGQDGLAYDRGAWSASWPVADTTEAVTGKYLSIARRQEDGSWLWTHVIWNSDAPMPEPEMPQPE